MTQLQWTCQNSRCQAINKTKAGEARVCKRCRWYHATDKTERKPEKPKGK